MDREELDGQIASRDGDQLVVTGTDPAQLNTRLVTAGLRVTEIRPARRSLEDLVLELTSLKINGKRYALTTDHWSKNGSSRGKATAAKVGGGAAVGAVLGGIFGGGKGAAIGAAAGAGAGTGVSAATKGQQIILHPEAVIAFQLQGPVTVTPGTNRSAMNQ